MMAELPEVLVPFADAIKRTEMPIIAATVLEHSPAPQGLSQLGGVPWWPAARPYPTGKDGAPLFLLAQINFAECATLESFPAQGLLQFFIGSTRDYLYGCNLDDLLRPNAFQCVYHDTLEPRCLTQFDFLSAPAEDCILPLTEPLRARALLLSSDTMTVDWSDYRFAKLLPEIAARDDLIDLYQEFASAPAIRLGGYPTLTQSDPRAFAEVALGDVTLLTVDTTDGIMWGDSGAGQFFMHAEDLRRRDFSKVAYNWDCC